MNNKICHVCQANIELRTPAYGIGWASQTTRGVFAWFNDRDRAMEVMTMLHKLKDMSPMVVWDLTKGEVIDRSH